nr:lipopolysaccharide biosynthesis protein [Streptomyces tsukubensis NRRL18488]
MAAPLSDDTIRLATVGRIFRRRRRLIAVLAVVGALVGYGTSMVFPPRYTASASVLLPGAWEERELLTQVEIATSSSVLDRTAAALGRPGVNGAALRDRVSAKTTDGNIIKVSGTEDTPERAQQLADRLAQQFVAFAARITGGGTETEAATAPAALRQKVVDTNRRITDLAKAADTGQSVESVQARTVLQKLSTALEEAMEKLERAESATDKGGLVVMGPAPRPTGEAPPTRIQLVVAGTLLSVLLTIVGHLTAARMNRRLRTEPEIAAALGSELLGTVDVPADHSAQRARGPRARIRRLLGTDTRWDVPAPQTSGDETSRRIRYRRLCARLREQHPAPRRLLVVVPRGDGIAGLAAAQLVTEAGSDPSANAADRGCPELRVVEVPVDRPMVPDSDTESGALVVLSAGTWTAGELAGLAGACADGGHDVVGIVVAGPVPAGPERPAERTPDDAAPALAVRGHATGEPV